MERSTAFLHPIMRPRAEKLIAILHQAHKDQQIKTWFMPFETYRTPARQQKLYDQGRTISGNIVTQAKPWQSAHQYGLALDLVPYMPLNPGLSSSAYRWTWDAPKSDWDFMHTEARKLGFRTIAGDSPHVEDPTFQDYRTINQWVMERDIAPF